MWEGCTPVLGAEPEPSLHEITGWDIPGVGEVDVESQGYRLTVHPSDGSLHVELAFSGTYAESETTPYRRLGPARLVLKSVRSLDTETPGAADGSWWQRVLRGDSRDEILRMTWNQDEDVLHVREGGTLLSCAGGSWRWQLDT
ncbi:hypothetical protein ACIRQY_22630 [Streptomyces sp. NPDC101490]|uniref:hypothetical protein n=1 Tax=Streptomyces sp. NPDC101490 TaxID=3366143 RepID=UPI003815B9B0